MTLQRQTISVPLGSGQSDEATRPLVEGNETSRNFTFPKTGQAQKRPPPLVMSTTGLSTAALNSVVDVDGIPAILDNLGSATYDPSQNNWVRTNKTAPVQSIALVDPLIRVGSYCASSCVAILGDIMCCAWIDGRTSYTDPAPMVAFFSIANGAVVMVSPPARVTGAVGAVRLATIDSGDSNARIVMFTGGLKVASWLPASGVYAFGSFATPSGTFIGGSAFDVVSDSSAAYACQRSNAAIDEVASILVKIEANGTITQKVVPYAVESLCLDTVGSRLIGIGLDVSGGGPSIDQPGNVMVATCDFGAGWSVGNWTQVVTIGRHKAVGRFNATDFAIVHSRIGITNNDSTSTAAWGVKVEIRSPSGLTLATGHIESAAVCSPPTYIPETGACVILLADNNGLYSNLDLGPNLYLAALTITDGVLHARKVAHVSQAALINHLAVSGQSGPTYDEFGSYGTRLARDSDGVVYFPVQVETGVPGLATSKPVIDLARVNIVNPPPLRTVNVADIVVAASGFGVESVETTYCATMCLAPTMPFRIADIIPMTGPGLGTLPGTSIVSLWFGWVWIDMQGNEHRAAPCPAYTGSVGNFYVVDTPLVTPRMIQLPLPVCRETRLEERGVELYFDVWSSGEDAVPGYVGRFLARTSPGYPDCVVCHLDAGAGTVTLANATVIGVGGGGNLAWWQSELEPNPPPASLDLVSWQSRIWALSAVRRKTIIASKPIQRGFAPEFAAELEVTIPDAGGDCVALAALDDKVIVFKERNIYVVSGDPGDSLGNGSTLQQPRLVSGDVGCICAQSVVEGPFGVAFQSQRGFYTLSRGLELAFVGDKVQALTEDDGTLRFCGALSPRESIVRWTAARSSWAATWEPLDYGLAWDFIRGQWSHWTDYDARHHAVVDGVMHRVSNTQVIKELLPGDYTTSESLVALKSQWLKLNGLAGFQRVWRLSFVLKHYTGHLKAEIFYDYATESVESVVWLEPDIVALRGSQNIVTLSMRPAQQKCQAIQVQFSEFITFPGEPLPGEENPPPATVGRGFEPISVDLEIGTKSGTYRRALSAIAKR